MSAMLDRRGDAFAVGFAFLAALSVVTSHSVLTSRDTGTFPDASQAAASLSRLLQPGDRVLANVPTNGPLSYYLDKFGVPESYLESDELRARRWLVVVNQSEGESLQAVSSRETLRDSGRVRPPSIVARFPASLIALFERRDDAATK